jgi:hypothetical protein
VLASVAVNSMTDIQIRPFKQSLRRGLPHMTRRMMVVLIRLRIADENDEPFEALADVHFRTLRSLLERDWIVDDPGLDGIRYKITSRGLKALKVYEPQVKRTDGLCPRCCERPRRMRKTGIAAPYCAECGNQMSRRKYRLGLYRLKAEGLCSRCHKRPRFVTTTGRAYSQCRHCKNLRRRREHRRERQQLLKRILAGEHVPCRKQGCDQPVHVFGKTVNDYCHQHWKDYTNAYNDRRRSQSLAAKDRAGAR